MKRAGELVRVNFGQEKFWFDIDGLIKVTENSTQVIIGALKLILPSEREDSP